MNLSMKQKQINRHRTDLRLPRPRGGRMEWELGVSRCQLLYRKWINKALLYSIGNYIQYPVINHDGKEHEKECVYMCN